MSEYRYNGTCNECGGHQGSHYNDCTYDGISNESYGSSYYRRKRSDTATGKWWIGYIIALIIGYGINELLGVIIIIGLIFWLIIN